MGTLTLERTATTQGQRVQALAWFLLEHSSGRNWHGLAARHRYAKLLQRCQRWADRHGVNLWQWEPTDGQVALLRHLWTNYGRGE